MDLVARLRAASNARRIFNGFGDEVLGYSGDGAMLKDAADEIERLRATLLKTADEWLAEREFDDVVILDPDGWDRSNFDASWSERINREEFRRRIAQSTIRRDVNG